MEQKEKNDLICFFSGRGAGGGGGWGWQQGAAGRAGEPMPHKNAVN